MNLKHCPDCKEKSVTTKIYTNQDNEKKRVMFCVNKGCGYAVDTTEAMNQKDVIE